MLRAIDGGQKPKIGIVEYVWMSDPEFGYFTSKTRVVPVFQGHDGPMPRMDPWTATTEKGERVIVIPDYYLPDPFQPQPAYVALCEVRTKDNFPHEINTRAKLRAVIEKEGGRRLAEWGFRQEYIGVMPEIDGSDWKAVQDHLLRCVDAGVMIYSASCVGRANWCFRIGRRPDIDEALGQNHTLEICDHLVLARYFMKKAIREHQANLAIIGTGEVRFSTVEMRERDVPLQSVVERIASKAILPAGTHIESCEEGYIVVSNLSPTFNPYTIAASLLGVFAGN